MWIKKKGERPPHTINRITGMQKAGGFVVSLGLYFLMFEVQVENVLLSMIWNSTLVRLTGKVMELTLAGPLSRCITKGQEGEERKTRKSRKAFLSHYSHKGSTHAFYL